MNGMYFRGGGGITQGEMMAGAFEAGAVQTRPRGAKAKALTRAATKVAGGQRGLERGAGNLMAGGLTGRGRT